MTACELCKGSCCKSIAFPLSWFKSSDMAWVALHGDVEPDRVRINQSCSMFKDGKCTIYETRPKACRDYPVGCDSCLKVVAKFAQDKDKVLEAINGR